MANGSDVNRMAERLASTTYGSYRAVVDHAVELQEQNVLFAQSLVEGWIRGLRRQSERNWEMAQELVDRAEEQSDAFQGFVEESIDVYLKSFPYTPFSY
jgi:hypothetical protein